MNANSIKDFKQEYTEDERKEQSDLLLAKHNGRIPVIIEYEKTLKKVLMPSDVNISVLMYRLRKLVNLKPEEAIFLFIVGENGTVLLVKMTEMVTQVYEQNKHNDGFLYVKMSRESTFGGIKNMVWKVNYYMWKSKPLYKRLEIASFFKPVGFYIFVPEFYEAIKLSSYSTDTIEFLKRRIINIFYPALVPSELQLNFIKPNGKITKTFSNLDYMYIDEIENMAHDDTFLYCVAKKKKNRCYVVTRINELYELRNKNMIV